MLKCIAIEELKMHDLYLTNGQKCKIFFLRKRSFWMALKSILISYARPKPDKDVKCPGVVPGVGKSPTPGIDKISKKKNTMVTRGKGPSAS